MEQYIYTQNLVGCPLLEISWVEENMRWDPWGKPQRYRLASCLRSWMMQRVKK